MPAVARSAALSVAAWLVPALVAVATVPIIVRGIGAAGYGILALIAGLSGYLGLLELGLGQAVLRHVSLHVARNEGRTVRGLLARALVWFTVIGIVGGVALWLLTPWIVRDLLHVARPLQPAAIKAFYLGAVSFALGMPVSVLSIVPQAFLRYDIVAANNIVLASLSNAGPAALVLMGYGLVPVAAFSVLLNAASLVSYGFASVGLVRSLDRQSGPGWGVIRRDVLSLAGVTAAQRAQSVITQQTSKFVVGIAGGVALTGYYSVPYVISDRLNDLAAKVGQVLFPHGAHLVAKEDREGVRTLYLRASRLLLVLNASITASVFAFSYPILKFWINPAFAAQGSVALGLLALTQVVNAACIPASFLNLALGQARVNFWFSLINSVVSLALVYPLTVRFGLAGTATAGLIGCIAVPAFIFYSQKRVIGVGTWLALKRCYLPPIVGCSVASFVAHQWLAQVPQNLIVTLLLMAVVSALAMGLSGLMGGLRAEDMATLRSSFGRVSKATR